MNSNSQAGQDLFAYEMCGRKTDGNFLDIGSYNLVMSNNSHSLEQLGWKGICCDIFKDEANLPRRMCQFIHGDARKVDWLRELTDARMPPVIDYLSLDVDDATVETLAKLPLDFFRFNVATIEHDAYRIGNEPRDKIRAIMREHGYDLVCEDVMVNYPEGQVNPFEDWLVSPEFSERANKFRCKGKHWKEIVGV